MKKIRQSFNLTQGDLAKKLGVGQPYISGLEKGREKPSDTFVYLFCQLFFIRKEWLLNGKYPILKNPADIAAELRSQLDLKTVAEVVRHLSDKSRQTRAGGESSGRDENLSLLSDYLEWLKDQLEAIFPQFEGWREQQGNNKAGNKATKE